MGQKTAVIALLCTVAATKIEQKDISLLSLASTISSNLGLLTLSKEEAANSGDYSELVQLDGEVRRGAGISQSVLDEIGNAAFDPSPGEDPEEEQAQPSESSEE